VFFLAGIFEIIFILRQLSRGKYTFPDSVPRGFTINSDNLREGTLARGANFSDRYPKDEVCPLVSKLKQCISAMGGSSQQLSCKKIFLLENISDGNLHGLMQANI
jgi:hypothetical protein